MKSFLKILEADKKHGMGAILPNIPQFKVGDFIKLIRKNDLENLPIEVQKFLLDNETYTIISINENGKLDIGATITKDDKKVKFLIGQNRFMKTKITYKEKIEPKEEDKKIENSDNIAVIITLKSSKKFENEEEFTETVDKILEIGLKNSRYFVKPDTKDSYQIIGMTKRENIEKFKNVDGVVNVEEYIRKPKVPLKGISKEEEDWN